MTSLGYSPTDPAKAGLPGALASSSASGGHLDYLLGFIDGAAERADKLGADRFSDRTITGYTIEALATDDGAEYAMFDQTGTKVAGGLSTDIESAVIICEGLLQSIGHPPVRISQIEASVARLAPTLPVHERARLASLAADRIVALREERHPS